MDLILSLRQWMAESKFFEVQCEAHTQLSLNQSSHRIELVELYLEALVAQNKLIPTELVLELTEDLLSRNLIKAHGWLERISSSEQKRHFRRTQFIKIQIAERQGQLKELYNLISEFQLYLYQVNVPSFPELIRNYSEKYFRGDFHLRLQALALYLNLGDFLKSEQLVKELLFSSVEKSSPKGIKDKLSSLRDILRIEQSGSLEIYVNFCDLSIEGIREQKDFKKLAEMVIYFDDFRLQVLVLDLMFKLDLKNELSIYAESIKQNQNYDYVYLDKFFNHLKTYFFKRAEVKTEVVNNRLEVDLSLDSNFKETTRSERLVEEPVAEEKLLEHILKYQDYSAHELCEIAVSFLQSELPGVALSASDLALKKSADDQAYLKACYLKLTSLLQLADYRAALDVALMALGKSKNQDDILSFMYGQAEAYLKLKETRLAKNILKKIISIDANYRMARERLDKINEV